MDTAPELLALHGDYVYWTELTSTALGLCSGSEPVSAVRRAPKIGATEAEVETLHDSIMNIRAIAVDGDAVFVTTANTCSANGSIERIPLDGGPPERIYETGAHTIALNEGTAFFTTRVGFTICDQSGAVRRLSGEDGAADYVGGRNDDVQLVDSPREIVVDSEWIYWSDQCVGIVRAPIDYMEL